MTEREGATRHRNEVIVAGRLSAAAIEKVLPSGDRVVSWRLVVERPAQVSRTGVDVIDCAAFGARVRRSALRWTPGEVVEVSGAIRRRFWRSGAATASRWEIDVTKAAAIR
jgi:single-strand DNA-binding protein